MHLDTSFFCSAFAFVTSAFDYDNNSKKQQQEKERRKFSKPTELDVNDKMSCISASAVAALAANVVFVAATVAAIVT